ncbi:hypothetical protein G9U53_32570 [Rhodococcus sp. D-46]|uniref:hypothetical protein n=1 Tax=Rhodococcus TaxID=1827 RepID=UPI00064195A4|nr:MULTISPECIES: hypothetical protein [Rhodococcus]KLN72904.1 hypothetical protein ABM90_03400 [Rhodococcus erythropolis]NHE69041.1 hypothetical protein [Rhodococcus sp. D-46]AZI65507.1 hypothetical protein EHW12_30785 [Rhodococcus sp. NJ-530]KSU67466.1 hypothetical protein AS032_31700 [Rhodococcus qingshengii]SCC69481.1 hypothetical protein GA0061093_12842 [Rhodococcus qingshengii]
MSELASTAGRWVSEHRRPLTIGGVVVAVSALIIGIVSVVAQRDDPVDMQAYAVPIVSINDIPAREFIGWSQQAVDVRPQNSPVPERMSAPDNGQCVPGGKLQTAVQSMVLSGSRWSGNKFVNPGGAQIMNVQLSNSPNTNPDVIDDWLSSCAQTHLVVDGAGDQELRLASLPVTPEFYRLDDARVYTATLEGDRTMTTMTGWGIADGITVQVDFTFVGQPSDEAIAQFDVVWRAQAGKLVGMQEAGVL